ncbi:MAG: hypothetical protein P1P76_10435 [Anaerolineales bacterium]|nr:hypothetical protein [Anaerolineales bacterium]
MSQIKRGYLRSPINIIFLAAYPTLSLLAFNIDQIFPRDVIRSLVFSIIAATTILILLRLLTRSWQSAAVFTSLFLIWFFAYGRLYAPIKSTSIDGIVIGRHRFLLPLWTIIISALAVWLQKYPKTIPVLNSGLVTFSSVLICLPLIQLLAFHYMSSKTPVSVQPTSTSIEWSEDAIPPDIYYIVLDGYTRSDVLAEQYGFDNSGFLDSLEESGFEIADCAISNYTRTRHSLTSTFNIEYIQSLVSSEDISRTETSLISLLKDNFVRARLESLGYKTIAFKHPWERFVWDDADILYQSSGSGLMNPFEDLLLRTTVVRVYLDLQQSETLQLSDQINYVDTLYALEQLPKIPSVNGPKFVFAHLIIPHPPFVFGPEGERIHIPYDADAGNIYTEENYRRGYVAAVKYINTRMLEILPEIIQSSNTEPIIIVAGDHGSPWGGNVNAVKIIAAFFTPGQSSLFYENITPVNVFRIIFNSYFNGEFSLLPDQSYISGKREFTEVEHDEGNCRVEQ